MPAQRIIDTAEECGADLIVMGTHGRGGLLRELLGIVAERVVRTSHVPVLTVSPDEHVSATDKSVLAQP